MSLRQLSPLSHSLRQVTTVTSDIGQTLSFLIKFTTTELFPKSTQSAFVRFVQTSLQVCLTKSEKQLQ